MNHRILWSLIPIVFFIILSSSEAYADHQVPVYGMDLDGNVLSVDYITPDHNQTLPCIAFPSQPKCNVTITDGTTISNDEEIIDDEPIINNKKHDDNNDAIPPKTFLSDLKPNDTPIQNEILIDNNPHSIHSKDEKTTANIIKYFQYKLDDSYSDEFINVMSEYGNNTAYWKHFNANNTNPLSFSHMMKSAVLPFKRGGNDVYNISDDRMTWIDKEGIQYEKNSYDSFKRLTPISSAKKCDLPENVMTRNHCDFDKIIQYEKKRAESNLKLLDKKLFSPSFEEIDNIFAYEFPEIDHRTKFLMDNGMLDFVRGVENDKN